MTSPAHIPILSVRNLVASFRTPAGPLRAVDNVSFDVSARQRIAIVGESGSGKTTVALSTLRLLSPEDAFIEAGHVLWHGSDLLTMSERQMRALRGAKLAMVFQEPMTSLNPVYSVGWQIMEALHAHERISRRQARARALEMLQLVGVPAAASRMNDYPHQLSGGLRQRVMIAMALVCQPEVLLADEPTTALDATVQAQILDLLMRLQDQLGASVVLITHDLSVVASFAQSVLVMYAGQVVEYAPAREIFESPAHPYTRALLRCRPGAETRERGALITLPGRIPDLRRPIVGCRFADRCAEAFARCASEAPELTAVNAAHGARCWLVQSGGLT